MSGPSDNDLFDDETKPALSAIRFVGPYGIEAELGSGGMGTVYRARGPKGEVVALKVLDQRLKKAHAQERFEREGLIRIQHPNVVAIYDQGHDTDGTPYIAMELVEGEALSRRLERGKLSIAEAKDLGLQIARGLAAAHAQGIVHRDLKPDNVVITLDGVAKILDFGIALMVDDEHRLTTTGMVVGTAEYVAPEQAKGDADLDARVDLWSFGVVLYECLAGAAPFSRGNMIATVVAILREAHAPLREVEPRVPHAFAQVLHRCLEKDRAHRWASAEDLVMALEAVDVSEDAEPTGEYAVPGARLRVHEQRLVAILLAEGVREMRPIQVAIEAQGGSFMSILGNRAVGLFGGESWEGDELDRAGVAALACEAHAERVSVAAGRATSADAGFLGSVVKAAEAAAHSGVKGVAVREEGARGLMRRFDVVGVSQGFGSLVQRHISSPLPPRPNTIAVPMSSDDLEPETHGRDSIAPGGPADAPLVGREAEVAQIDAAIREFLESWRAQAMVITGSPGIGKSRLRREAELRLARAEPPVQLLSGRADALGRTSALSMVAAVLRRRLRAGTQELAWPRADADAPVEERQRAIQALARDAIEEWADADAVAPFLGELIGVPMPESAELSAARSDPQLMADRLRLAVRDYFGGLAKRGPTAVVLEDVHWADAASLEVFDDLLERSADDPLFIFATARPLAEGKELFAGREVRRIEPKGLLPSDLARVVRHAAGRDVAEALVATLVERTGGNPLFVEQIIAQLRERKMLDAPPETIPLPLTVEAAVQSRLDHLPAFEKDLCKRAAVLGRPFAAEEIGALGVPDPKGLLENLRKRGLMTVRQAQRVGRGREYRFHSPVFGEVAYGMLADDTRKELHRRAAAFLGSSPDVEPEEIAQHHEKGEEFERAANRYAQATESAHRRGDSESVLRCSDKSLEYGAPGDALYALHMARADAFQFLGRAADQYSALEGAFAAAHDRGECARVLTGRVGCLFRLGRPAEAFETAEKAFQEAKAFGDLDTAGLAAARLAQACTMVGRFSGALEALSWAKETPHPPHIAGTIAAASAYVTYSLGDFSRVRDEYTAALDSFQRAGDVRRVAMSQANLGDILVRLGLYEEARLALRGAVVAGDRAGTRLVSAYALINLADAARWGGGTPPKDLLDELERRLPHLKDAALRTIVARVRATIHAHEGELAAALQAAEDAVKCAQEAHLPVHELRARIALARIAIDRQDRDRAELELSAAQMLRSALGTESEVDFDLNFLLFEVRQVEGDEAGATEALQEAGRVLVRTADRISDPTTRASYLRATPAHAQIWSEIQSGSVQLGD